MSEQGEYKGLVHNKKAFVITARGDSFAPGTPDFECDFQAPLLRAVFNLIGVSDINFIHANNLAGGSEMRQKSLTVARTAIQNAIAAYGDLKL